MVVVAGQVGLELMVILVPMEHLEDLVPPGLPYASFQHSLHIFFATKSYTLCLKTVPTY